MDLLTRLLAFRFRISTQLFAAFGVAVALTVAASLIGWFSFIRVGDAQAEVNEGSIPEMEAAFGVAEYSNALGAAAPRLATSSDIVEVSRVWLEIVEAKRPFEEYLETLRGADAERAERIGAYSLALETYIETIRENMERVFDIDDRSTELLNEMEALETQLEGDLIPVVDDRLFYILTGRRDIDESVVPSPQVHFSSAEFDTYRHLSALQADTNIALQQLTTVFRIFDPALLEAQLERFESSLPALTATWVPCMTLRWKGD